MQFQLARSQWWPLQKLQAAQLTQLRAVLAHASGTVPFYRERLAAAGFDARTFSWNDFFSLPLLSRGEAQAADRDLLSTQLPKDHAPVAEGYTSGSTGKPVHFFSTSVEQFFWHALTLREHLWHRRDLRGKLAGIRAKVDTADGHGWGPSTDAVYETGPGFLLNIATPVRRQVDWLVERDPDYLLTHASNLQALAREFFGGSIRLGALKQVISIGEAVTPELRAACREAWNVGLADMYSAQEVGYIALQCPDHEHYHVQAENVLVEVLDEAGCACAPGSIGRVVVTSLHNFAMPFIRYDIGDYAEVGEACACGRGLPVLRRIFGRTRNMLVLPNGDRSWPVYGLPKLARIYPIKQIQLLQKDLEHIEVNLVVEGTPGPLIEREMAAVITESLGHPFRIAFSYRREIPCAPSGKFEDFVCEIAGTAKG